RMLAALAGEPPDAPAQEERHVDSEVERELRDAIASADVEPITAAPLAQAPGVEPQDGPRPPAPPRLGSLRLQPRFFSSREGTGGQERRVRATLPELSNAGLKLAQKHATGRWELSALGAVRELWLEEGELIAAVSSQPDESLLQKAHRDGLVDSK